MHTLGRAALLGLLVIVLFSPAVVFAAPVSVTVSGYVVDSADSPVQGAIVSFYNPSTATSTNGTTGADGFYSFSITNGTYKIGVFPPSGSGLSVYYRPNTQITQDMSFDVQLKPLVSFLDTTVTPKQVPQGGVGNAVFKVVLNGTSTAKTGLQDSDFRVWIHDWTDPQGFWVAQQPNQYHLNLTDTVFVSETGTPGQYSFSFNLPADFSSPGRWIDLQVAYGDPSGWTGFQVVASTAVELRGRVTALNGTALANVWVNLWNPANQTGGGNPTNATGYYSIIVSRGIYILNAWPGQNNDLSGFFLQGFNMSSNREYNITLTPRAGFSQILVNPRSVKVGASATASFNLTSGSPEPPQPGQPPNPNPSGPALSGIPDSAFTVWLHNWRDPNAQNWWQNPSENQYHKDISGSVTVAETTPNSGRYSFSFAIPASMNVTGTWIDMQVRLGDSMGWTGFQVASSSAVELRGWVKAYNNTALNNVGVGLWDPVEMQGSWSQTNASGFYSMLVEPGVYSVNAWAGNSDLGGFFRQGYSLTADSTLNITLSPRASFSQIDVSPRNVKVGSSAAVSFNLTRGGSPPQPGQPPNPNPSGPPLSGLTDSAFSVWLHNWREPNAQNWWQNPSENQYHKDISGSVTVAEIAPNSGRYGFTFAIPESMNVTGRWIDMEVRVGDSMGWTGIQVASSSSVELRGWVRAVNGTGLANVGMGLWDPVNQQGTWTQTNSSGYYSMLAESGIYILNAWPGPSDLGGFFRQGFNMSADRVFNITLTPRASFSQIDVNPRSLRLGASATASFNLTTGGSPPQPGQPPNPNPSGPPLSGLTDSAFTVWLHNWRDPAGHEWWQNPSENQYHKDISNNVTISENPADSGRYGFTFSVPVSMNVTGRWIDMQIQMGDSMGWTGLQLASGSAKQLSGWVKASNGTALANVGIGLWNPVNQTGAWGQTDNTGQFLLVAEPGIYVLNAWPGSDPTLGGFFRPGFNLSSDRVYNITLTPRASFSQIEVNPRSLKLGASSIAVFNLTTGGSPPQPGQPPNPNPSGPPLSGLTDSAFTVWLHNWRDPNGQQWWNNPSENQYHKDITNSVNVTESSTGSGNYNFTFSIPVSMNVTGRWIDMQIQMGDSQGWTGLQVASASAKQLSGWVMAANGTGIADVGVNLWNPVNQTGSWSQTDSSGRYLLVAEPGTYVLNVWAKQDSGLGGYFRHGFNLTNDEVLNITLTPRASFSMVQVNPRSLKVGGSATASFNLTTGGSPPQPGQPPNPNPSGPALSGIPDSAFTVWLHNWRDPNGQQWWNNPRENQYHKDISNDVTISEIAPNSGRYRFNFTVPVSMNVTGSWIDMQIQMGDSQGWTGLQLASASAKQLSGWVKASNGTALANVGVGLWNPVNQTGSWSQTDSSGQFLMVVEPGTYMLNAWAGPETGLGGFFKQGFSLTTDRVFNITLTPRANFSPVEVNPRSMKLGTVATASFNLTTGGSPPQPGQPPNPNPSGPPLSGIEDSAFTVWLHNWRDPVGHEWWQNPSENQYHKDISNDVTISEIAPNSGSYSFTFTVPVSMNVTGSWIDMQIQMGDSQGWTGLQLASASAKQLSGWVKASNGTGLADVGVNLWNPVNQTGSWTPTNGTGYYALIAEPGTYVLNAWAKQDSGLGGFFRPGFNLTQDTVLNITLTPRASFSQIVVNPRNMKLGTVATASFNLTTGGSPPQPGQPPNPNPSGPALSGIPDSAFTVWLHNWRDPNGQQWWENPRQNQYHKDISNDVTISEIAPNSGSYSFTFTVPVSMNVTGRWIDMQIQMGDSQGWTGLQLASASAKQLTGWVKAANGTGIADVGVNLWNPVNQTGSSTQTNGTGYYSLIAESGSYVLNAWPKQESGLGGFFLPGYNLTSDTVFNITLTQQANLTPVRLSVRNFKVGSSVGASFNVTKVSGGPLSGLEDSAFTVWLHNWRDPNGQQWWENPVQNQYHKDISGNVTVVELPLGTGSYNFTFNVPSNMNITGGFIDMQVRLGNRDSWTGMQVASASSKQLRGYVKSVTGALLGNVTVSLWNPINEMATDAITKNKGFYSLFVEPGVYVLKVQPAMNSPLSEYTVIGLDMTIDRVLNITLAKKIVINSVMLSPVPFSPPDTVTVTFNVSYTNGTRVTGLLDSSFQIWINNWNDTGVWLANPVPNAYHQNISTDAVVTEVAPGKYSFTFTIPAAMVIQPENMGLEINIVRFGGWVSTESIGLPISVT